MRRVTRGFTVLELLVVIGIIAVLISLLLPVVTRVREHANLSVCMSNQRQIYTAIKGFAQNNDMYTQSAMPAGSQNLGLGKGDICPGSSGELIVGSLPQTTGTNPPNANGIGQAISSSDSVSQASIEQTQRSILIIRQYLPNSSVFRCPERTLHPACYSGKLFTPTVFHYAFCTHFIGNGRTDANGLPSYGPLYYQWYPTAPPTTPPSLLPWTLTRAKNPSECVLITEDGHWNDGKQRDYVVEMPLGRLEACPVHSRRASKSSDAFPNTNADYAVCTYVDGHTESVLVNTTLGDPDAFTVPTDCTGLH